MARSEHLIKSAPDLVCCHQIIIIMVAFLFDIVTLVTESKSIFEIKSKDNFQVFVQVQYPKWSIM